MKVVFQQFLFRLHGHQEESLVKSLTTKYYESVRFFEALVLVGSSSCCLEL